MTAIQSISLPKLYIIENSKCLCAMSGYKIICLKALIYNEEHTSLWKLLIIWLIYISENVFYWYVNHTFKS